MATGTVNVVRSGGASSLNQRTKGMRSSAICSSASRRAGIGGVHPWVDSSDHRAGSRCAAFKVVDHPTAKQGAIQHKHTLPQFRPGLLWLGGGGCRLRRSRVCEPIVNERGWRDRAGHDPCGHIRRWFRRRTWSHRAYHYPLHVGLRRHVTSINLCHVRRCNF